jgi:hypothetical protein
MYASPALSALPESPIDLLEDLNADLALTMAKDTSLDDLLAESMAEKRKADDVKAARFSVANCKMPQAERDALTASIRSWEAKREWLPQAAVVMFTRQQCLGCGQFHTQFLGWFQRQKHRTSQIDRWIPSIKPHDDKLLRESKYQDSHAEMCQDCAEHLGFDVEEG